MTADNCAGAVLGSLRLEQFLIPKLLNQLLRIAEHEIQVHGLKFQHVGIYSALARSIDFWRSLLTSQLNIAFDSSALDRADVQDEFDKLVQSWLWLQDNVLVPDYVDWDLRFEPEIVKVFPNSNLLLDELSPMVRELFKVKIGDGKIVRPRAHHVKKRCYTVKRASH